MADTFKIRVGVVVFDEQNRLLLARQNQKPFWVLPGGTLEKGENLRECAIREIKEESGLDIQLGSLYCVSDFFAPDGRQALDIVFFGFLEGGSLVPETTQNIDEIGFFRKEEVVSKVLKPDAIFEKLLVYWNMPEAFPGEYFETVPEPVATAR